jgi:chemotaxis protein CheX
MTVTATSIEEVVHDVWSTYAETSLQPAVPPEAEPRSALGMVTGRIFVTGAWIGSIEVEASRVLATEAAARMLGIDPDAVSFADVKDALGELTNIIGGNIKSMLPGPSHLSLPAVWEGSAPRIRRQHEQKVDAATLAIGDERLSVTVWENTERVGSRWL